MRGFGPHVLLDCYECDRESLLDLNTVFDFLDKLPEKIGMTKIDQPKVFKYSGLHPEDHGVTGTVILAESHCSFHSFPDREGFVTIDVYSCKPIDHNIILAEVEKYFNPQGYEMRIIERGLSFCQFTSESLELTQST